MIGCRSVYSQGNSPLGGAGGLYLAVLPTSTLSKEPHFDGSSDIGCSDLTGIASPDATSPHWGIAEPPIISTFPAASLTAIEMPGDVHANGVCGECEENINLEASCRNRLGRLVYRLPSGRGSGPENILERDRAVPRRQWNFPRGRH
jgi:hypothetical protein